MDTKRVSDAPLRTTVFAKRHKTQPAALDDWEIPVDPPSRLRIPTPSTVATSVSVQEGDKQDEEVRVILEAS